MSADNFWTRITSNGKWYYQISHGKKSYQSEIKNVFFALQVQSFRLKKQTGKNVAGANLKCLTEFKVCLWIPHSFQIFLSRNKGEILYKKLFYFQKIQVARFYLTFSDQWYFLYPLKMSENIGFLTISGDIEM